MSRTLPSGTNIRIMLIACRCPGELLSSHGSVAPLIADAVRACEMTPLETTGHDFPGAGHSTCLLLAESHVAVHTYPECSETVIVELSVCDHLRDNSGRAEQLARRMVDIFQPEEYVQETSPMCPRGPAIKR